MDHLCLSHKAIFQDRPRVKNRRFRRAEFFEYHESHTIHSLRVYLDLCKMKPFLIILSTFSTCVVWYMTKICWWKPDFVVWLHVGLVLNNGLNLSPTIINNELWFYWLNLILIRVAGQTFQISTKRIIKNKSLIGYFNNNCHFGLTSKLYWLGI